MNTMTFAEAMHILYTFPVFGAMKDTARFIYIELILRFMEAGKTGQTYVELAEAELAEKLNCSRGKISAAIDQLISLGVVRSIRVGQGRPNHFCNLVLPEEMICDNPKLPETGLSESEHLDDQDLSIQMRKNCTSECNNINVDKIRLDKIDTRAFDAQKSAFLKKVGYDTLPDRLKPLALAIVNTMVRSLESDSTWIDGKWWDIAALRETFDLISRPVVEYIAANLPYAKPLRIPAAIETYMRTVIVRAITNLPFVSAMQQQPASMAVKAPSSAKTLHQARKKSSICDIKQSDLSDELRLIESLAMPRAT